MINQYHIIDDFYSNPDEVVKFALESIKEREFCWRNDSYFIFS